MKHHISRLLASAIRQLPIPALLILLFWGTAAAQTPITVSVNVLPPYSPDLAVWRANPSRVLIVLINNDQSKSYQVRLSGTAKNQDGGIDMVTKDDFPVSPILVPAGGTKSLNANDLRLFDPNSVKITGADKNVIARTGRLPEGNYRICVRALDHATLAPLSAGEPTGCTGFTIRIAEEPKPLVPHCGSKVKQKSPQLVQFQWSLPTGAPGRTLYEFMLVELQPAMRSAEDALRSSRNYFFSRKNISATNLQYGPGEPVLVKGRKYAWRVRAYDPINNTPFRNDGYSEACTFEYGDGGALIADIPDSLKWVNPKGGGVKMGGLGIYALEDISDSGDCPGGCFAPEPANMNPSGIVPAIGDTLTVGKFKMALTQISSSAGKLSGKGIIKVPYLKGGIKVEFGGITINSGKVMIAGQVTGQQGGNSPLVADTIKANDFKAIALAWVSNKVNDLMTLAQQNLVSAISGYKEVSLPLGLDQEIGGENYTVIVYGVVFTSTEARINTLLSVPMPEMLSPSKTLVFGATGICIHPDGISGTGGKGLAKLQLITTIGYNNPTGFSFLFKGQSDQEIGNFATFDCTGFKEMSIVADVIFPKSWFLPIPNNGENAKATIRANIKEHGNWIGQVDPVKWEIVPLKGFKLDISEMYYDHTDSLNPAGMLFPGGFKGDTSSKWHGFFVKTANVVMPEAFKTFQGGSPNLALTNMIIGTGGINVDISATSIIQYPKGNFGGWAASIDSVGIRIVNSSLENGKMIGKFGLPITKVPLDYTGTLSNPGAGQSLIYSFNIVPQDTIQADLWLAKLNIHNNSEIKFGNDNPQKEFIASAKLHGMVEFPEVIGDAVNWIPGMDLRGIAFNNFGLSSKPTYFSPGTWALASPDHAVGGFPASIKSVKVAADVANGLRFGVKFIVDLHLCDQLSGGAGLSIWSKLETGGEGQKMKFDGVELDSIYVDADMGVVELQGAVGFYRNHEVFGNGFKGSLHASIAKMVEVDAIAQFGSVKAPGDANPFRYWYVDARAAFKAGIPLGTTGAGFYGFGGGVWYNMERENKEMAPITAGDNPSTPGPGAPPGTSANGFSFIPKKDKFGFKATAVVGSYPSPYGFNADITVGIGLIKTPSGLGMDWINLLGQGYMMSDVINRPAKPMVKASADISYWFNEKKFTGIFNFDANVLDVISATGKIDLLFSPTKWHVKIGEPANRIKMGIGPGGMYKVDSYIMAGMDLPDAKISDVVPMQYADDFAAIGFDINESMRDFVPGGNPSLGFAFGGSTSLGTGGPQKFLIFYADIFAAAGFDIALKKYSNTKCKETGDEIGVDGWYASGRAFAFLTGDVGIEVDLDFVSGRFSIFKLDAGAQLKGALPNPTWLSGRVAAAYEILGGLISGYADFGFDVGQHCTIEAENPLVSVPLITEIKPTGTKVSVFAEPRAAFTFGIDKEFQLEELSPGGQKSFRKFKVVLDNLTLTNTKTGKTVSGTWGLSPDGRQVGFVPHTILDSMTKYEFKISVSGKEWIASKWVQTVDKQKNPIKHDTSCTFTSGSQPDTIPQKNVVYSTPRYRQRYFLQKQDPERFVLARVAQPNLWQPKPGAVTTYKARYIPLTGGPIISVPITAPSDGKTVKIGKPVLDNSTTYLLQIVRKDSMPPSSVTLTKTDTLYRKTKTITMLRSAKVGEKIVAGSSPNNGERVLYNYHFRTSAYNTVNEKTADMKIEDVEYKKAFNVVLLKPTFTSKERFDSADITRTGYHLVSTQPLWRDPVFKFDVGKRDAPWYKKFSEPAIYNAVKYLRDIELWKQGYLQREKLPAVSYNDKPRKPLKDSEVKMSSPGSQPMTGLGGQTIGGREAEDPRVDHHFSYYDGLHAPFDYQTVRDRAAQLLAEYESQPKGILGKSGVGWDSQPTGSIPKDGWLLDADGVKKVQAILKHDKYKPLLAGIYELVMRASNSPVTPANVRQFVVGGFQVKGTD